LIDHQSELRVGVINDFCVISPESANNWKNYILQQGDNPAMPDTYRVVLKSSYKSSKHSLNMFPDVIQKACYNKQLLDLEYIKQTDLDVFDHPIDDVVEYPESSKRIRRSGKAVRWNGNQYCPARYCKEFNGECVQSEEPLPNTNMYKWKWRAISTAMTTICNTRDNGAKCHDDKSLPMCWYQQGTIEGGGYREDTMKKKKIPIFIHLASQDVFCMPCCRKHRIDNLRIQDISLKIRNAPNQKGKTDDDWLNQVNNANKNKNNIPICTDIATRGQMCKWYYDHGRCGEAFPTATNQFVFISEDLTYHSDIKEKRDACLKRPAEKIQQKTDSIMDYYDLYDYYK
jgi:hypothetical protein